MAGSDRDGDLVLASSLGHREERPGFHGDVHSDRARHRRLLLGILVEGNSLLWKVCTTAYLFRENDISYYFYYLS